jgi:GT2 family glycosyltransferase
MIDYRIPPGVEPIYMNKQVLLSTPQGGRVMIDRMVLQLWQAANQHTLPEILAFFQSHPSDPLYIRAGLTCLAEAGLIERNGISQAVPVTDLSSDARVAVVIVSYNSRDWLGNCLDSLAAQSHTPFEIIIVDNGSQDQSADWIEQNRPEIRLIHLEQPVALAQAINTGLRSISAEYYLLLNPDVHLAKDAIAQMVQVAKGYPDCAAVAAKLRLLWAPHFLNGLGNLVGPISWGSDIGLGHLDLGQFDNWKELPSACFAAALIPAKALEEVGYLDEQFPLYYEDSEWCYRARLFGYTIQAAPAALVYHAYSGRVPKEKKGSLSASKLKNVVFGRLNFITKLNGSGYLLRFLLNYCLEDIARFSLAAIQGRRDMAEAIVHGWQAYLRSLDALKKRREENQARRQLSNRRLYQLQRQAPKPFIKQGFPLLTWDDICFHYSPLIYAGLTCELPELEGLDKDECARARRLSRSLTMQRIGHIWRNEGLAGLLHRIGKAVQWRIMQT